MPKRAHSQITPSFSIEIDALSRHAQSQVVTDTLSLDGRRTKRQDRVVFVPLAEEPPKTKRRVDTNDLLNWDTPESDSRDERVSNEVVSMGFATTEHDAFLKEWIAERDHFLAELHRLEGRRGMDSHTCRHCGKDGALYRCRECLGGELNCQQCCVDQHLRLPFHTVEQWNGTFFERTTLKALGHTLQLGHLPGDPCSNPKFGPRSFTVMHTNGLHPVTVLFCRCSDAASFASRADQLLRAELYPATLTDPATCFSFQCLKQFHLLTLQSKISGYDQYLATQYLTDNLGLAPPVDRVKAFMRVVREWRHLKMLKRGGRGFDVEGVAATKPGELAVRCPACPQPSVNLPENWEAVSDDIKYIYTMFIAIDANFRLRRRAVSNEERDPALGSGWAYFVEDRSYRAHLLDYVTQEEISTCTGFAALQNANSKLKKGYATSGVAMAIDARHGFILPNAVGDLQKGERYCNIDYIISCYLRMSHGRRPPIPLVLSYDIICQWIKNFVARMMLFPEHLQIELPAGEVRYVIPKYHFNGHTGKNHNQFSLNIRRGVGRIDCEEIERNWSRHNSTATSTREMGPGSRHDTLEDHFGYANFRKYVGLGVHLQRAQLRAEVLGIDQKEVFDSFLAQLNPDNVARWIEDADAWEADLSLPDPYESKSSRLTEAEIRFQLAEEDDRAEEKGEESLHHVTPAAMVIDLLYLEDQQRRFKLRYNPKTSSNSTAHQRAELLEKRTALRRRINAIRQVQAIYMPCVPQLVATHQLSLRAAAKRTSGASAEAVVEHAEDQPLFLPSALDEQQSALCVSGLAGIELRLREGQLQESLEKIRIQLHVKSRLIGDKQRNVRGQRPNTRAISKINTNEAKIVAFAEKYRAARRAHFALAGHGDWEKEFRELRKEDVRTLAPEQVRPKPAKGKAKGKAPAQVVVDELSKQPSEGTRTTSWIWMSADTTSDASQTHTDMQSALRVEFLKARGRVLRFEEEINIIKEEKRRTLVTLEHEALTWDQRQGLPFTDSGALSEGLAAYAARQASVRRGLKAKFTSIWTSTPRVPNAAPCATSVQSLDNSTLPKTGASPSSTSPPDLLNPPFAVAAATVDATATPSTILSIAPPLPADTIATGSADDLANFSFSSLDAAQSTSVTDAVADILRGVALYDSDDSDVDILARDDYSDDEE